MRTCGPALLGQPPKHLFSKLTERMRASGLGTWGGWIWGLTLLGSVVLGCSKPRVPVDLLVLNATVYTVDSAFSKAQAFAVRDGKFVAVGTSADMQRRFAARQTVDAGGQFIYPGFQDAHCHFYYYALGLREAKLGTATTWPAAVAQLIAHRRQQPHAAWLTGSGWDQTKWPGQHFPTKDTLDQLFPDVPVLLWRVDGHAVVVNSAALRKAGFDAATQITGGRLAHGPDGSLTGLLLDNAASAVAALIRPPSPAETVTLLREAERRCLAVGLTSLSDMGLTRPEILRLDSLYRRRQLHLRLNAYAMLSDAPTRAYYLANGPVPGSRLSVPGFKVFVDGALGSRGACLRRPYADRPHETGFLRLPLDTLRHYVSQVAASRMQLAAHAIGDSTNHLLLNLYGAALHGDTKRRWRIEHAQIITPSEVPLFGRYGIIPSVQPAHATSDMAWAGQRLGAARLPSAYAYAALQKAAGQMALGSDFPVEDINPLYGFYAAFTRQNVKGEPAAGFLPANRLSRIQALRCMSSGAAYAAFAEQTTGQIKAGMQADFVVLGVDLLTASPKVIRSASVRQTWVGGQRLR